jgi:NAD(P)H-hydrate epimerase
MLPIVTPDEMRAIDAAASEPVEVFIERAGAAVARTAVRMLGGTYGRTVDVIVGPGNNGADGRVAARLLAARGVRVRLHDAAECPDIIEGSNLVVDAAFGTGGRPGWVAPEVGDTPVLAVDIPSGVDGLTGVAGPGVLPADRTVTFAAWKPGLLFGQGRDLAGEVQVADVGLLVERAGAHLLERSDVAASWPRRSASAHKWRAAVRVIAGSATMPGAAALVAGGALRAGAGMVHVSSPGAEGPGQLPVEVVQRPLPAAGWADEALRSVDRFHAVVLGPGLGRNDDTAASARFTAVNLPLPLVIDGDGLFALAWNAAGAAALLRDRTAPTVLTPHDGEYQVLTGSLPGGDRMVAARRLAFDTRSVVLLKGPTTVVAAPSGEVMVVAAGDERLATAGTGDVLAGIVGALLAQQVPPFQAAALAAWVHGEAARRGPAVGLVASDLPALLPAVLHDLGVAGR